MSRVSELFLFDIFVAIHKIKETVKNQTDGNELKHNYMAWDTVIREFEIIGEATKHLIESDVFSKDKREIVNFRNVLIHEYFGIDEEEVFDIATNKLDELEKLVVLKIDLMEQELKAELLEDTLEENKYLTFIVIALSKFHF